MEIRQADNDGGVTMGGIMMGGITAQMDHDLYTDQLRPVVKLEK